MTRSTRFAVPLAFLVSTTAQAQQVFDLGEIVVSGNLDETTLERIGATVSVVTREELEQSGETRAIDYISRLPGVDVRARGPIGNAASVTIRGVGQNYVRVLVDGIDVTDTSSPQTAFDFGGLRTIDLDRIEILRGGQSALFGSESVGGVINITTRRAVEEGVTRYLTAEAGSYDTYALSFGATVKQSAYDYAVTVSAIETEGFSTADENDGNTEPDGYSARRLSFAAGYALDNGGRIGINGFIEAAKAEFDEQFPIEDGSPDELTNNTAKGLRLLAELPTGTVDSEFALTFYSIERVTTGSDGIFTANNTYQGERIGASYLGQTLLRDGLDLRFGLDATRESYDQFGDYGSGSGEANMIGAFVELAYAPSADLDLVGTLRYDEHSEFGGFTTGRLAANWRPAQDWILRASAATSFRAPSLYELYGPYGDPALEAEESRSLDLGLERRFGDGDFIRATLFYSETDNLIDYVWPAYVQVPGTATRQGVELEAGFALNSAWRVDASYTYTEGENPAISAGNAWSLEFPAHDLSLTVSGTLTDRLSAAFTVQRVADRPTLGDYTVANASFGYALRDGVEAYLRVENLTDEEYQLLSGYGTSDRAFYAGIRAEF